MSCFAFLRDEGMERWMERERWRVVWEVGQEEVEGVFFFVFVFFFLKCVYM